MKYNKKEILDLHNSSSSITETAKKYCTLKNERYTDNVRRRVSKIINNEDSDLENTTTTETNQYESAFSPLSALKGDGSIMDIKEYCNHYKIPFEQVRTYKLVTHTGKGAYYNIASNEVKVENQQQFFDKVLSEIANLPNLPKTVEREKTNLEEFLFVVDLADLHIGKLADSFETGEDYNNQIAVQRAKEGIEGLITKVKGFPIDKILFVGGNDILHVDTPKNTTTSGTYQDGDGMWYSNFLIAKQLYIELITRLLDVADVHFVFNPSNHDYMSGFFLADVIKTYFRHNNNITFDCSISHRKYFLYGQNLIGTTHGDGAKESDLPLLMAHEATDMWSKSKHRYIYSHHIHHKASKDYMGVCVESLRSPSSADSWHYRNGFVGGVKAVEGFIHSKTQGQLARITHIF